MDLMTLVAKVTFDDAEYQAGLAKIQKDTNAQADKMRSGLLTATGAGVAALGAFAASSVKTGAEFDSSMSQVAATMGKTMGEMESEVGTVDTAFGTFSGNLREYAQFMGSNTAFSAKQAADALNYMALAGYDTQTSMNMLPNVLNLAAAGNMDLATASDMVTDAQTALNLTTEETSQMVDKMAMTASKSNTSVSQLGEAYLALGATGRNLAGGTTELSTVLGVLADNGIKGAEGGTKLRNVILSLQTPTKDGAEALKKLGMTYDDMYDSAGNMRALPEIFEQMQGAMEGMTQAQKDAIVQGLFNRGDMAAINALLGTTSERYDELAGQIDNAAGSAQKMADTQLDNLEGDITLLKSAFEGLQIQVADKLMPAFRTVVKSLTDFITNIEKYIPIITAAATAFGTFAVVVNISSILQKVAVAAKALFAVFTTGTGPIGLVIAGLAALVTWFITTYNTNEEFRNKVNEIWENVKETISGVVETIVGFFSETIPQALESLKEWFSNALNTIVETFQQWGENISTFITETVPQWIESIGEFFSHLPERIGYALGFAIGTLIKWGADIVSWASTAIPQFIENVVSFFATLPSRIWEWLVVAINNIITWGSNMISSGRAAMSNFLSTVVSVISSLPSRIWTWLGTAANRVVEWGSNLASRGRAAIQTMLSAITSAASSIPSKMAEIGGNIVKGVWNGITSMAGWFKSQVTSFFSGIVSGVKGALKIASPSKVFAEIGRFMAEGLGVGWNDAYDSVKKDIEGGLQFDGSELGATLASTGGLGAQNSIGGYSQVVNVYSPEALSPWEVARQTKNATREMLLNFK